MTTKDKNNSANEEQLNVDAAATAAMQQQTKVALYNLIKQCEAMGIDLKEMFPQPPSSNDVIPGIPTPAPGQVIYVQAPQQQANAPVPRRPGVAMYPGSINSDWYRWEKGDLDPNDTKEFVPMPIPGCVYPRLDEFGRAKMKIDVNDLVCWLTIGEVNRVNMVFYYAYLNALQSWQDLEAYKKKGPTGAPWGLTGPGGQPAWFYEPFAVTNGMTLDGRSLVQGEKTIVQELDELGKANLLEE